MDFDFELTLVSITALSGLIWAAYALAQRRRGVPAASTADASENTGNRLVEAADAEKDTAKPASDVSKEPVLVEYARSFFPVLLAVLILRSFIVEPFKIPSGSMIPTLWIDDFILVNKFSYGVRLPVLHTKILHTGEPQRGDVAVFRYPLDPAIDYIKRIVGVPGDVITYHNKVLRINGEPVNLELLGPYTGPGAELGAKEFRESFGDVEHSILLTPQGLAREGEWVVPEGHYFAMGDNRDNSHDSRFWGVVPAENLVGKAFLIWMNWDGGGEVTWSRIGNSIK